MNGGMRMDILDEKIDGVDVLIPQGRLDASSAKDIKEKISSLIKENRIKLVMDMSAVDFIDSSGLGSLVSSLRSLNKLGGDIKLASLQDQVRAIFELTRLHRVFQVFDERKEAVKNF